MREKIENSLLVEMQVFSGVPSVYEGIWSGKRFETPSLFVGELWDGGGCLNSANITCISHVHVSGLLQTFLRT